MTFDAEAVAATHRAAVRQAWLDLSTEFVNESELGSCPSLGRRWDRQKYLSVVKQEGDQ